MTDVDTVLSRFRRARIKATDRDVRMAQILAIREGRMNEVAPELFPEAGPFQEPIVANMIDIAARDTAEMIAPLPSISCASPSMVSDKDQERADTRTKICQGIVSQSALQVQMYTGADQYLSYGFLPGIVESDSDRTVIRLINPMGCYWDEDRFRRVTAFYQLLHIDPRDACDLYPDRAGAIKAAYGEGVSLPHTTEMLVYHDASTDIMVLPNCNGKSVTLRETDNKFGQCRVRIARRPGAPRPRGQYDDVMFVQLAKARFALLAMESANESVQAPLVVPSDVQDVPMGPGAVIHTDQGDRVRKLDMSTPREVWTQQGALDSEMRIGSRYPEVRTGNSEASVITGRGVQALMGTMDTQIRTASAVMAHFLTELLALSLEYEEYRHGDTKQTMTGTNSGVPFTVSYRPSRDIKGDYTVDVQYGLMAGLDPNRWLIFGLQARSEKLISRDYLRRQMPADIDAGDEERKIDMEDMRDAAKQAFAGYAQALPALVQQGQDPSQILAAIATVVDERAKGTPIEEAIAKALAPPEPSPEEQAAQAAAAGGGGLGGVGIDGLMPDVAPGQAGMAPGGRPDLRIALASMDQSGTPRLSVGVSRREAI